MADDPQYCLKKPRYHQWYTYPSLRTTALLGENCCVLVKLSGLKHSCTSSANKMATSCQSQNRETKPESVT